MQFGVVIPSYGPFADRSRIHDAIVAAEELGYDTAWFGDHIVIPGYAAHVSDPHWFDALACCIYGAGITSRLRFGTDVLVLPTHHPVALSQLVASADQMCGGRLTLGVGVGYIHGEFEAVGAPPYAERGAVTDEYLDVLTTLWSSTGATSFAGHYVAFHDVHAAPPPAQRPMALWVGGNGGRARRRAARKGTGWHPLFPTAAKYAEGRAEILDERSRLGLTAPFTFSYSCPETRVLLDASERRAPISYADLGDIPAEYGYAPAFPVGSDGRPLFVGDPDQVAGDIEAMAAAGVDHVALRFWTGDPAMDLAGLVAQFERFAEQVAPRFRAA